MGIDINGVSGTAKPYESEIDRAIRDMDAVVSTEIRRLGTDVSDGVSRANASARDAIDAAQLFEDGVIILTGDEIHDMFVSVGED